jgi:hypothetical protein
VRGETTDEYAQRVGDNWTYFGGLAGDPGIVSDAARYWGDKYVLDAERLDELAEDDGWEWHDAGYHEKVGSLAGELRSRRET